MTKVNSMPAARPARLLRLALVGALAVACALVVAPGTASAQQFDFAPDSVKVDPFDSTAWYDGSGGYDAQAGSHPFQVTTRFKFTERLDGSGMALPTEQVRDTVADLPPGLIGNPRALPRCSWRSLNHSGKCPLATQVGYVMLDWIPVNPPRGTGFFPLYNMEPTDGHVAEFGFATSLGMNQLVVNVRPGDYGVRVRAERIIQGGPVFGAAVTVWGVPGAAAHDPDRGRQCTSGAEDLEWFDFWCRPWGNSFDGPVHPFLTNPTYCGGPWRSELRARSWVQPDRWISATATSGAAMSGCERLDFDPSIALTPDTTAPDSPTGLRFDLEVPQPNNTTEVGQVGGANALATSALRTARVTLPEGMTVNPSSADGLGACSDAQVALDSESAPTCPDSSKIGTLSVETPLLDRPAEGTVYLGRQTTGQLLRLFLVVDDQGVLMKIPGVVDPDPATGQLVATFRNAPQLPFSKLRMELKSGPRAPLATPQTCGPKTTVAELTPWSGGPTKTVTDTFTVDCPGASGFAPTLKAGAVEPLAGDFSPFVVRIDRPDRQQILKGVTLDLPEGLLASLKGVPLCADAAAAAGTCPAATRVGTAGVAAGSGPSPFYLTGQPVYLTEGYKGAPYGLAVVVRALAGPLDLGTVIVRQALHVDPDDAHVKVVSDPLPTIVEGVPIRLRAVNVEVDRPRFTLNPTSCATKRVEGLMTSTSGAVHRTGTRFQAGGCSALAFTPRLALGLSGTKQRRTGGHPGLHAVLTQSSGQSNIGAVKVVLPKSIALDPGNANGLCKFDVGQKVDGDAVGCPASSVIGTATATTPILNRPLKGKVYFVEHKERSKQGNLISKLPSLLVALRGEVNIDLRGYSSVKAGRLVNTFPAVPDAPVSKFDMRLKGGNGGILTVTRSARRTFDVCKGRHTAAIETDGQNGKRADYSVRMKSPCAASVVKTKKGGRR